MLNPAEEAKYAELRDKARELRVPLPPEIMIDLKVHDKKGAIVFDDIQRGHSWTRNYWNWLYMMGASVRCSGATGYAAGYMNLRKIDGNYATNNGGWTLDLTPAQGGGVDSTFSGIVIGTDDAADNADSYALGALIAAGTGPGQMSYQADVNAGNSYNAETHVWTSSFSRIINNNSGASITVNETGIAGNMEYTSGLIERSVLSPQVVVPNGAQLTVTYQISMDFSAID